MTDYPWYIELENGDVSLAQGDLVFNCPVINPPTQIEPANPVDVEIVEYNVIIISQSCDLDNDNITMVQVCPFFDLEDHTFIERSSNSRDKKKRKESIRQGNLPGYHLLNNNPPSGLNDFLIVDFRNTYAVHRLFLKAFIRQQTPRIRLLPPYREHLAQSFARYFMRVGLPVDIPPFK